MPRKELDDVLSKTSTLAPKPMKLKTIHTLASINETPLIKIYKFENVYKDHKPKRIAGSFNDKYIEYKSEGNEKLSMEQYLKLTNVTDNLKAPGK